MTDASGRAIEAEPLKGDATEEGVSKEDSGKGKLGLAHMSGWRTAIFLLSLFLCLSVVFAFSFILPCPVRPQYRSTWNHTIHAAASYDFLAVDYANGDKVLDVLFMYRDADASRNTCLSEGLALPCVVLVALDGTDGRTLWHRPLEAELRWVQCGVKGIANGSGCVVAHAHNLTAVATETGLIVWQRLLSSGMGINPPLISLPDVNADNAQDFALLSYSAFTPTRCELLFFSGKSGAVIGSGVDVGVAGAFAHLQLDTPSGAPYLLLLTDAALVALSVKGVAARAGLQTPLKEEKSWQEKSRSSTDGIITLFQSASLRRVLVAPGSSAASLLVQTHTSVSLLDTHTLKTSWTSNTSALLSAPAFGQFDKDGVPDVMMEEDLGNGTKRVVVLSGRSGHVLWEMNLWLGTSRPRPASVRTLKTYSLFMLWGRSQHNHTAQSFFLLHPRFSHLLLERKNPEQNILAFKATLLERGRHACYLLLSGADARLPAHDSHALILTKRKIKADASQSAVVGVAAGEEPVSPDAEKSVKEEFYRLRFSDDM